jgi:Cu(I)/Ag(I) efflux system membrane fusion protein
MTQHQPERGREADQPHGAPRSSARNAFWFTLKAIEIRLRFIAVLVGIGLVIGYWDTIQNYWDKWTRPAAGAATELVGGEEFYCPMHPTVIRDGLDPSGAIPQCPICGMPLSKRKKGQAEPLPEGILSRVQLSPYRVQLAGIQTAEVTHRPLVLDVRALGYVAVDERKLARLVVRAAGYVEKLYVNESFAMVRAGEPLAEIYSPDLYTAAQELLIAQRGQNAGLIAVAREKLALLGVAAEEIDQISRSGDASSRLVIRAPHGGHVFQKNIVDGDRVEAGQMLFEVADLSTVWIEGELYEQDAAALVRGQTVAATVDAYPGRVFEGRVSLVHPHVETATRTLRVRCEVENPNHELRPGMFATLAFKTPIVELESFRSQLQAERLAETLRRELAEKLAHASGDGDATATLAAEDTQPLADAQQVCPVTGLKLGSMGTPLPVVHDGRAVLLCCAGCTEKFHAQPDYFLDRLRSVTEDGVLAVPELSVIDTGDQQVVYIERKPGVFEGVSVTLGPRAGGYYAVIDGLRAGDRVAAAGAFLVDAETRLNPATSGTYFGASGTEHKH